ncbi:glycosyltransferase [Halomicrobium salinisoli]|uniref:glycosyltransferase n=1 Tax=Halomicrobium salinisoli TaxID=2878391 RepID=UPI001CF07BDD|nr:glycosyltransferase [Halomicrobium salinisoli]
MVETHRVADDERRAVEPTGDGPALAVVVPVYDDPDGVRRTVQSLAASEYDPLAVHVVYTPADGETAGVLDDLNQEIPSLSVHRERDHETPGAARNVGIDRADADVVCFVDADMTVEDGYFSTIARVFDDSSVEYLGLPVEMRDDDLDLTAAGFYDARVRFANRAFLEERGFCPTCSLAVRETVFADGLRFDPTLTAGEDVIFGHQVAAEGYEMGFCPDATATHPVRNSVRAVAEKGAKSGRGFRQMELRYEGGPDRPYALTASAWTPESPSWLARACRNWSGLSLPRKTVVWGFASFEHLCRTAGYLRAVAAADAGPDSRPAETERGPNRNSPEGERSGND